ncbi:stage V sporulation protein D [Longirhabdus pacifica]|uniref:stage V sporulation protein D n=1 Tax=Longirhabdus pacifica TaxID=2305227 RepID=UPI001008EC50|nr:stage V sporulation protein D [Longirhabdus pacifica]
MKVANVTMRKRIFIVIVGVTVMFLAMIFRLGYIQLWTGQDLANKAEDSWRKNIPFTASRGEILDRNGIPLAYNVSSPTVMVVPAQIKDAPSTAKQLAFILNMNEEKLLQMITKRQLIVKLQPEGRKITLEKANEIKELNLSGVTVAEDNQRYYPYTNLASHVLGFTGIDNQGLTGLELYYDEFLQGSSGSVSFLSDARGKEMPGSSQQYTEPRDGLNLRLTLDKHIQTIVERELDEAMITHRPDHVLAIAMDPNNGEILAMASRPDYEPSQYQEYDIEVINRNLPIWMTYEPGSTFKIITIAAAIEEQKVNLKTETFFDPGYIEVAGARPRCWKRGGHGSQTFLEVVQNSCNPGFVVLGQRLGKESLFEYIQNFGFGKKTGIDMKGEENGILFNLENVGPVELATTSFGQGVSVTPIQQIAAVSAAINGGKLYQPQIADAWIHPETGKVVEEIDKKLIREVISEETSSEVRDTLEHVVAEGTGRNAFVDGYRVGGKTGTAQKVVNGRYSPTEHIVSFVGFAPADDPQIVIYIAVDNPKGLQFGGLIAAPIVQNILQDTLPYMGVEPRQEQIEKKYIYGDTPLVEVPDLMGRSKQEIYEMLSSNFTLSTYGVGSTIINQAPKPGTKVQRGSSIKVYLSNHIEEEHDHAHD